MADTCNFNAEEMETAGGNRPWGSLVGSSSRVSELRVQWEIMLSKKLREKVTEKTSDIFLASHTNAHMYINTHKHTYTHD